MLGWIRWSGERRLCLERVQLRGMPLLTLYLPRRERGLERRAERAARELASRRVARVLTPPDFALWPLLLKGGLRPVDAAGLRRALAVPWVLEALRARGLPPERAAVCLSGTRVSPELTQTAWGLCPLVRRLIVDAPEGERLATRLRRQFGLPVLPPGAVRPDLTLCFREGVLLEGASFSLTGEPLPEDCERMALLAALWECGCIRTEDIRISVDFP